MCDKFKTFLNSSKRFSHFPLHPLSVHWSGEGKKLIIIFSFSKLYLPHTCQLRLAHRRKGIKLLMVVCRVLTIMSRSNGSPIVAEKVFSFLRIAKNTNRYQDNQVE